MKNSLFAIARTILTAGLIMGGFACSDGSDNTPEPAAAPGLPGTFGVGHSTFVAIDPLRDNRTLAVDVWYPVDAEDLQESPRTSYPLAAGIGLESMISVEDLPVSKRENQSLLVFSHGYGGISTASAGLMETLASHGFIVIAPEHTGNSQTSNDDTFDQAAANRVPDVSFLIDTMSNRSLDHDDMFFKRINASNTGVVGHSFGGMTAAGMAAGWGGAEPDPRVRAIAPISAVFDGDLQSDERSGPNAGFSAQQLGRITVPVMLIGGTADVNVFIENNDIAFAQIQNSPHLYKLDILGANHTHFANVCDIGNLLIKLGIQQDNWPLIGAEDLLEPYATTCSESAFPIAEVVRLQNVYIVSFFKRFLLDDRRYDYYLSPEYAASEAAARIVVK